MGIINGLLTGGILVGKVCQALSGFSSNRKLVHKGVTLIGEVSSGGVTFYRKNLDGQSVVHAANTSTKSSATIVVPNENEQGGVTYVLNPLETIPFGEAESQNVSPTVNITTGLTEVPDGESVSAGKGSLFKLSFSGLQLGKVVSVGSFKIACNTTQLIITSSLVTVNALTYMWLNSNKGVSATSQTRIPPNPNLEGADQSFNIDFATIGINPSIDSIEGQITLEIDSSSDIRLLSKIPSKPFDEAELIYFGIHS